MEQTQENAPLRAGSEEDLIPRVSQRSSNSYPLKVAGLTVLACLLLSSQALMAYMVFSHRGQIHTLEKNTMEMKKLLANRPRVQAAPVQMHLPMNNIPLLMELPEQTDLADTSPSPAGEAAESLKTKCNIEAFGPHQASLGSFRPKCDELGRYKPVQCWVGAGFCWCVNANGSPIEGTHTRGKPQCPGVDAQSPARIRMPAAFHRLQLKPILDAEEMKSEE